MDFTRQLSIIDMKQLQKMSVTIIGAGAIGSFIALTLSKIGINKIDVFDEDGVTSHNLPNQFYRIKDIGQFKTDALQEVIKEFSGVSIKNRKSFFTSQKLNSMVIIATDTMRSRKLVWGQFLKQDQCKYYIEARMGGQLGIVYSIINKNIPNIRFYESTLYDDKDVAPLRCTERAIIDNILMISSLICRAVRAVISKEKFPREMIFDMQHINKASFMIRE